MVAEQGSVYGAMTTTMRVEDIGEYSDWINEATSIADTAPPVTQGSTGPDEAMRRMKWHVQNKFGED